MKIFNLYKDFVEELNEIKATIKVNNQDTTELLFKNYEIDYDLIFCEKLDITASNKFDEIEREEFLIETEEKTCSLLINDLYTRQFVIQKKYYGKNDLASCIPLLCIIVRDNTIYSKIVVRSQNIENFLYDNQTFMKIMKRVVDIYYYNTGKILFYGPIQVDIISLHKILKRDIK